MTKKELQEVDRRIKARENAAFKIYARQDNPQDPSYYAFCMTVGVILLLGIALLIN